uniref:Uncharacterized protein n=1 Tax=Salmo trutta TaxID=8032 RepID=A0A673W2D2_SALTR
MVQVLNKLIGPKYIALGSVGGGALVYFTDWRLILDWVLYQRFHQTEAGRGSS